MLSQTVFDWAILGWIILGVLTFILLSKIVAPFGRHTTNKYGPLVPNRWAWIFMESPSLFLFGPLVIWGAAAKSTVIWVIFACWMLHYIHRTLIFPFRIRSKGKKMPLLIAVFAFFFQLINGFINGYSLGTLSQGYEENWLLDPRFIIGILFFLTGFVINQAADKTLIALRKPGETDYKIPKGGLYEWISCPNFFGEMLEWAGFALMCWNLAGLSFAVWTFFNLLPRAKAHHLWYKEKFPEYPPKRKAVIPGIY